MSIILPTNAYAAHLPQKHKKTLSGITHYWYTKIFNPDVHTYDDHTYTRLHYAAARGEVQNAKLLLERGADINARTDDNQTPLYLAILNGHYELCELLLSKGADPNIIEKNRGYSALHQAVASQNIALTKLLLSYRAHINEISLVRDTPLHLACSRENIALCELLLVAQADVNAANIHGGTPLHIATSHVRKNLLKEEMSKALCKKLLNYGAHINARNLAQETPGTHVCMGSEIVHLSMEQRSFCHCLYCWAEALE